MTSPINAPSPLAPAQSFLERTSASFDGKLTDLYQRLIEAQQKIDATDPKTLSAYQVALSAYTLFHSTQSKTVESYVNNQRQAINRLA
ncbi:MULTISPECIES: EscF/YscF/HrpA family type III secretion system needle major subunit [Dyella]|uniref:EscF/YscF/HrpA family type III secretion system needle major subunit n=2 Tax=Dyella TaxID=231454 RepID=A0A4R0YW59_9GAMM|nr:MULTISPECIES: EscF/YscF/HrpA family type III secretion system needle major subunit [Dyella]TBR38716.1 hypothetical protein EYV96_00205 [Dyella terrae]TCI13693.1 hypothetical protein EZM97_10665 [Dyella soli]